MAYCRQCGKELDDSAKFCPNCGAPCDGEVSPRLSDGGVDYQELKFSASVVNLGKRRNIAFSFAVISAVLDLAFLLTLIISFISSKNGAYLSYDIFNILITILIIVPIAFLPVIIVRFARLKVKNLSESSTIGDLRKITKDCELYFEILILSFFSLLMHFFICGSGVTTFTEIPRIKLMFTEPELLSLMYGKIFCAELYIAAVLILLNLAMGVCVVPIFLQQKKIFRYFLGRVAPDTPESLRGRASEMERELNRKLIERADSLILGEEYEKTVAVYYECYPDEEKAAIKNLKTEAVCNKYRRLKGITALSFVALYAVFIVWAALGSSHSSQTVRAGNAAKIELGSDRYSVERILYTPDSKAGNCYIYTDDSLKDADIDSFDDIEDLMNKKIKELRVYFIEDKVYEVIYDAGDYNSLKSKESEYTFVVGGRYEKLDETTGIHIDYKLDYFKDGSIRIYEDIR